MANQRGTLYVLFAAFLAAVAVSELSGGEPVAASQAQLSADPSVEVAPPAIEDSTSQAELQDLQTLAQQTGISLDAAVERYAWNDNFALTVDKIGRQAPDAFAGAGISGAHRAWVAFAGRAPEEALKVIDTFRRASSHVSIDVRTASGYTEQVLRKGIEEVHFSVLEVPNVGEATTTHNPKTQVIATTVLLKNTVAPDAVVEDLRTVAVNSLTSVAGEGILEHVSVSVTQATEPVLGGDDSKNRHMGGEDITGCTSGFGTMTPGGVRGLSTAGHCANSQSDDGASLTYKGGHEGTHGDFQWHTGPKTENDQFYSGSTSKLEVNERDVSSVGAPVLGQPLCRNGVISKKDCQEVRRLHVCDGGECNLVQMGARLSAPGDSGGPYFWGNTAYGLHEGWMYDPSWPYDRDTFSRGDRLDNALNTYIATS